MQRLILRCAAWLLVLALAACAPAGGAPLAASSGLRVWLDQPSTGAVLPLAVFTLRAHARDAGGSGVETITFLVSSGGPPVTVGSVTTDNTMPLVMAEFDWNPSAPGEYTLQAQAFDQDGYVFSEPARVCVGLEVGPDGVCGGPGPATPTPTQPAPTPSVTATDLTLRTATPTKTGQPSPGATATKTAPPATATSTNPAVPTATVTPTNTQAPTSTATLPPPSDTPQPTDTQPSADTAPPVIDKVSAAPNPTFYGSSCSKPQAEFTVGATVTDPAGVASVTVFYRYGSAGAAGAWQTAGMSPAGGDIFTATVVNDATAVYGQLGGADGYVEYFVEARDGLGNVGQSPSPVIAIQYCVG